MTEPDYVSRVSPPTILVVEDEVIIRLLVSDELRDAGFTVLEACNASEALEYLQSDPSVALVFTDVNMPGDMDGLGLARQIGLDYPGAAVIITSGHLFPGEGVANVPLILKPYDIHDLVAQIRLRTQARGDEGLEMAG